MQTQEQCATNLKICKSFFAGADFCCSFCFGNVLELKSTVDAEFA